MVMMAVQSCEYTKTRWIVHFKRVHSGIPWRSNGQDSGLPAQVAGIGPLVRELRSHMSRGGARTEATCRAGWREAEQGGDVCKLTADSRCFMAETNTALYSNYPPIKNLKKKEWTLWDVNSIWTEKRMRTTSTDVGVLFFVFFFFGVLFFEESCRTMSNIYHLRASLVAQWLRLCFPARRVRVQPLVRKLRF